MHLPFLPVQDPCSSTSHRAIGFANINALVNRRVNPNVTPQLCAIFAKSTGNWVNVVRKAFFPDTLVKDSSDPAESARLEQARLQHIQQFMPGVSPTNVVKFALLGRNPNSAYHHPFTQSRRIAVDRVLPPCRAIGPARAPRRAHKPVLGQVCRGPAQQPGAGRYSRHCHIPAVQLLWQPREPRSSSRVVHPFRGRSASRRLSDRSKHTSGESKHTTMIVTYCSQAASRNMSKPWTILYQRINSYSVWPSGRSWPRGCGDWR